MRNWTDWKNIGNHLGKMEKKGLEKVGGRKWKGFRQKSLGFRVTLGDESVLFIGRAEWRGERDAGHCKAMAEKRSEVSAGDAPREHIARWGNRGRSDSVSEEIKLCRRWRDYALWREMWCVREERYCLRWREVLSTTRRRIQEQRDWVSENLLLQKRKIDSQKRGN